MFFDRFTESGASVYLIGVTNLYTQQKLQHNFDISCLFR